MLAKVAQEVDGRVRSVLHLCGGSPCRRECCPIGGQPRIIDGFPGSDKPGEVRLVPAQGRVEDMISK